jgi:membrane-bound lytic murein transglycosylase MltF
VNQTAAPAPFGIHTDDLDEMLKRRNIRALVMINPIGFFYSNGQPMGVMYEGLRELESYINQKREFWVRSGRREKFRPFRGGDF